MIGTNDLIRSMASDPKLQKQLQRFMSDVVPAPAPSRPAGPTQAELERQAEQTRRAEANSPLRSRLRGLGYTDEGIAGITTLMQERGLGVDAAIALFERMNPPPEPLISSGATWGGPQPMPKGPDLTLLFQGDDEGFLGPAVANALKEVRGY